MDFNELTRSALADAKEVRKMAEANALQTLKEEFQPKIQRLVSQSIAEEDEDEDVEIDISVPGEDPSIGFGSEEEMSLSDEEELPIEDEDPEAMELEALMRELDGDMGMEDEEKPFMEGDEFDEEDSNDELNMEGNEIDDWSEEEIDEVLEALDDMDMEDDTEDLDEIDGSYDDKVSDRRPNTESRRRTKQLQVENKQLRANVNKAMQVITKLKTTINEVNLLNAKLMYSQKLFHEHELSEAKKVKILHAFDMAKSVREAKIINASILSTILKESKERGKQQSNASASKPTKQLSPKKQINEQTDFANRWKGLAGITGYDIYK